MQEMNEPSVMPEPGVVAEPGVVHEPEAMGTPVEDRARAAAGYFGLDEDRLDRAVADLDAALRQIGNEPTIEQILEVSRIQALLAIAGELRSIREAGIGQGDVL